MAPGGSDSAASRMAPLLAELNEQQREAVCAGDEPLLVVAGAGTGKTMTLAHRVAYLIASGVEPGRILLLTFTRRAAAEMLRRVAADGAPARSSSRDSSGKKKSSTATASR